MILRRTYWSKYEYDDVELLILYNKWKIPNFHILSTGLSDCDIWNSFKFTAPINICTFLNNSHGNLELNAIDFLCHFHGLYITTTCYCLWTGVIKRKYVRKNKNKLWTNFFVMINHKNVHITFCVQIHVTHTQSQMCWQERWHRKMCC